MRVTKDEVQAERNQQIQKPRDEGAVDIWRNESNQGSLQQTLKDGGKRGENYERFQISGGQACGREIRFVLCSQLALGAEPESKGGNAHGKDID